MATDSTHDLAIPAIEFSSHFWTPRAPEMFSKAEVRRQTGPYESALPARIVDWMPRMDSIDVADIAEATAALAQFDAYAHAHLGPENPALAPMSAILLRTESASSSQIEQLTASARQLALAEIDESDRSNAVTVVGNVRAMEAALRLADDLSETSILAMHRELLERQPGLEDEAGRYRAELVWIGDRANAGPRGAEFIAPQPELIPSAMSDLVAFMDRDDLPALVHVAVAHAQFETIHPFVDGNGRTGRALAQALLRGKELTTHITVPISAGILTDPARYFEALGDFRAGDAAPIVRRFAEASRYAAVTGRALVDDLVEQLESSRERLSGVRPQSTAWTLLPLFIGQPVVTIKYLVGALGITDVTAARALDALVSRGVIVERTGRARNRVWQHPGVLGVLDDYAKSIRRPLRRGA